jgi:hypothetical protein
MHNGGHFAKYSGVNLGCHHIPTILLLQIAFFKTVACPLPSPVSATDFTAKDGQPAVIRMRK